MQKGLPIACHAQQGGTYGAERAASRLGFLPDIDLGQHINVKSEQIAFLPISAFSNPIRMYHLTAFRVERCLSLPNWTIRSDAKGKRIKSRDTHKGHVSYGTERASDRLGLLSDIALCKQVNVKSEQIAFIPM